MNVTNRQIVSRYNNEFTENNRFLNDSFYGVDQLPTVCQVPTVTPHYDGGTSANFQDIESIKPWDGAFEPLSTSFCYVNPIQDRYKVADLNPLLQNRMMIQGQEWSYYDPRWWSGRQMLARDMMIGINRNNEQYTKIISSPEYSWCNTVAKNGGQPGFVDF